MKILNKNTTGTRNRALSELEVMQELTPGDKNYGKIAVGTDGTYDGEVLVGKDSDVQNALASIDATNPFNGYAGAKKDMRFETSASNILSVANMQEQYIVDGKVVEPTATIDLNTTNDRTGFNGEGDNSFVPNVHVVGFDPISTGSITGNHVAVDTQIGTILDNIPAQTANTRIKCRVKPTTDGIKVEILNKSDSDAVVRTQTVDGTDAETLTFTLPVNDDGYKVKATKITNDGVDSDDTDERIDVTSEVSTGLVVDGKVKRGDYVVVDKEELVENGTFDVDLSGWEVVSHSQELDNKRLHLYNTTSSAGWSKQPMPTSVGVDYVIFSDIEVVGGNTACGILIRKVSDNTIVRASTNNSTGNRKLSLSYRGTSEAVYIALMLNPKDDAQVDCYFDNISVKLADDTFKAIEDTADGESLASSKFKPADYLSNQVFVGMKDDGTYIYDVLMNDAYAKESTTETLSNNGYASLGRGLFSKGSDVITPVLRYQTTNAGLNHSMLNNLGTAKASDDKFWYDTDVEINDITDCFNSDTLLGGNIASGKSGRPDGKYYDVVYENQALDCRYSSTKTNLPELASKEFSDGVSGKGGVCDTVGMVYAEELTLSSVSNYAGNNKLVYTTVPSQIRVGQTIQCVVSGKALIGVVKIVSATEVHFFSTGPVLEYVSSPNAVIATYENLPITQSNGEQLVCDLIGLP